MSGAAGIETFNMKSDDCSPHRASLMMTQV